MAKLESTFKNMALSLTCITLVAAAALGGVYMLTAQKIATQAEEAKNAAKVAVLNGVEDGVAIETEADGFGGKIKLMVGFAQDGTILGYEVLEQQETPGLGTHIVEWFKNAGKPGQNIIGRQATGAFSVSKDGGDVDAITAATISSRAFLKAINSAYAEFMKQQGVDVSTGATMVNTDAASGATQPCVEHKDGCCEHQCNHECHKEGCCKEEMEATK
ncbi:MAG: FMN-binding protein [Paludibacteraceae bacterium]|nr:FMN-binding protein [Paludibacteraceae bacterium]